MDTTRTNEHGPDSDRLDYPIAVVGLALDRISRWSVDEVFYLKL